MRGTCAHLWRMSRMIQIRNVPDEVHRKLRVRAIREGVTLSELLAREARRLAEQPSLAEMLDRLAERAPVRPRTSAVRAVREAREGRGGR